jgi:hypothetical protein
LKKPIDTGFFNYDLFFRPTGSGVFELRSFLGGGAFVLPQLETAMQDMWHQGLRHLVRPHRRSKSAAQWRRCRSARLWPKRQARRGHAARRQYHPCGVGASLRQYARPRRLRESVNAFGETFRYNLDRNLESTDFQMGLDLGRRGLLSPNDILVLGVLGGFVNGTLDYDSISRAFDFEGGQVGGYATYLRGGLFVDTLANVHLFDVDTHSTMGFPGSLNAATVGVRTDSGYRFGSFKSGAFIEPLATIAVNWAEIDGPRRQQGVVRRRSRRQRPPRPPCRH